MDLGLSGCKFWMLGSRIGDVAGLHLGSQGLHWGVWGVAFGMSGGGIWDVRGCIWDVRALHLGRPALPLALSGLAFGLVWDFFGELQGDVFVLHGIRFRLLRGRLSSTSYSSVAFLASTPL